MMCLDFSKLHWLLRYLKNVIHEATQLLGNYKPHLFSQQHLLLLNCTPDLNKYKMWYIILMLFLYYYM